jgi:hypothetical protein
MARGETVDWALVIEHLRLRGFSLRAIEAETRIPKSTLLGYRDGAEPKHSDGQRLLALWSAQYGGDAPPPTWVPPTSAARA